jgi:hypothetical protein
MKTAFTFICGVLLTCVAWAQTQPTFRVAVSAPRGPVVLLVPPSATESDLANLVNLLHEAKKSGSFGKFFPPTTPGGSKGPYAAVEVFVMSDAAWATLAHVNAFMDGNGSEASQREFARRVRAFYLSPLTGKEVGSIGYEDQDLRYKTPNYKQLF